MPINKSVENFVQKAFSINNPHLHCTCKAFVASHVRTNEYKASYEGSLAPGQYDLSPDLIEVDTDETFMGQVCNLTLVPRRPYHEMLFPGDWISVYMSSGADAPSDFGVEGDPERSGENIRVFFGFLDAVRTSTQIEPNTGKATVRVSVSCSGMIKAFDRTVIYFNPALSPETRFGALLPGLATLTYGVPLVGTPTTIPRGLALAYLAYGGQFLMPESYAARLGSAEERQAYLKATLTDAVALEETMSFIETRGVKVGQTSQSQQRSVIQRMLDRHRDKFQANSFISVVDMFSHVEDFFVDGRVWATPFNIQQGSLWSCMYENCNPILNECFFTLTPDIAGKYVNRDIADEWGMRPKYTPSLVIRERPLSWLDNRVRKIAPQADQCTLKAPAPNGNKIDITLGDIFFSSVYRPIKMPPLQKAYTAATINAIRARARAGKRYQEAEDTAQAAARRFTEQMANLTGVSGGITANPFLGEGIPDISEIKGFYNKTLEEEKRRITEDTTKPDMDLIAGLSRASRWVDRVKLRNIDITGEVLGLSDNDHVNFFTIGSASIPIAQTIQKFVLLLDGLVPLYNSESIKRYGLRLKELTTKFMSTGGGKIDSKEAMDFLIRSLLLYDHWYQHQMAYRAGQIMCRPIPKAHVGMVLDISGSGREETFYIEGVAHKWSRNPETGGGMMQTTLTVTRGQPTEKRFNYAPPDSVKVFVGGVEVPRPESSKQPTVMRSIYATNADQLQLLLNLIRGKQSGEEGLPEDLLGNFEIYLKEYVQKLSKDQSTPITESALTVNDVRHVLKSKKYASNPEEIATFGEQRIQEILSKFDKLIEKKEMPPIYKTKSDREKIGLPPWATQPELQGAMWDPIRRNSPGVTDDKARIAIADQFKGK